MPEEQITPLEHLSSTYLKVLLKRGHFPNFPFTVEQTGMENGMGNRLTRVEPGPEVIHPEMQEESCPWSLPALEVPILELWEWSSKDAGVAVV